MSAAAALNRNVEIPNEVRRMLAVEGSALPSSY